MAPSPEVLVSIPLLALPLLAGCSSTGSREAEGKRMEVTAYDPRAMLERTTMGVYLTNLDRSIQAWNGLFLEGDSVRDARKLRNLEDSIADRVDKLFYELVGELESGPPNNRRVVAASLGFVSRKESMSPLLNALSDTDETVRSNALLSLAILGDSTTPTGGILEAMRTGSTSTIRGNAALALLEILRAGGKTDEEILTAARSALHDPEPLVRTQASLILAHGLDVGSIDDLALLLQDDDVHAVAMAAGRALAYMGSREPRVKGRCARALTAALAKVDGVVERSILTDLRKLARANFKDAGDWVEWSHRLD